jgi:hypothetical protein
VGAVEDGYRLNVHRMGEHVEYARRLQNEAEFVNQHPNIPGKAAWMAGNIQDPLRAKTCDSRQHRTRTGSRRVN